MKTVSLCWAMVFAWAILAAEPAPDPGATNAPKRVLLLTGVDHPAHAWRQTAPAMASLLRQDRRLEVFTVEDPHFLDSAALARYDVVVLYWQNWQEPGPGVAARNNLRQFVAQGKGLVVAHFGCGAWHDEWPGFVELAGRVWAGPNVHQHDPYGPFRVEIVQSAHPIVAGLADFDTQDELYTCLAGETSIEILAQARSKVDNKEYPMAFVARCGQGRTFHCTLGHDVKALTTPAVQDLFRRGCAWTAGLPPTPGAGGKPASP